MPRAWCLAAWLTIACAPPVASDEEDPAAVIGIVTDFGADCVARGARQLLVENGHPTRAVKVWLDRYYGDVRQPGRSAYVLQPGTDPQPLGCDRIDGRAQYWEVVKTRFHDGD